MAPAFSRIGKSDLLPPSMPTTARPLFTLRLFLPLLDDCSLVRIFSVAFGSNFDIKDPLVDERVTLTSPLPLVKVEGCHNLAIITLYS